MKLHYVLNCFLFLGIILLVCVVAVEKVYTDKQIKMIFNNQVELRRSLSAICPHDRFIDFDDYDLAVTDCGIGYSATCPNCGRVVFKNQDEYAVLSKKHYEKELEIIKRQLSYYG